MAAGNEQLQASNVTGRIPGSRILLAKPESRESRTYLILANLRIAAIKIDWQSYASATFFNRKLLEVPAREELKVLPLAASPLA